MGRRNKHQKQAPVNRSPVDPLQRAADAIARHRIVWLLIALAAVLMAALMLFDPKQSTGGDNGTYIALARSLLDGRGYRELYTPGQPYHHQYPFGYPLLLSGIGALFGQQLPLFNLFSVLCLVGGCVMAYDIVRRLAAKETGCVVALATVLMAGLNPSLLEFSHATLTEIPFLFASLAGLALVLRSQRDQRTDLWLLVAGLAVSAFSYYIRPNGITLLAAIGLNFLLRRNWKSALLAAAVTVLLLLPWSIYNHQTGSGLGQSVDIFFTKDVYNLDAGRLGFVDMLERMAENWQIYFGSVLPAMLLPFAQPVLASMMGVGRLLIAIIISGTLVIGMISRWRGKGMLVSLYLIGYLLLTLVWHPSVSSDRYLIPIYPLLLYLLISGTTWAAGRIRPSIALPTAIIMTVLLLAAATASILPQASANLEMLSAYRRGDPFAGYPPEWKSFYQAAEWTRDSIPPQAVVVSRKPSLFYLASDRESFCYPFTAHRQSVTEAIDRADYIMVEPVSGTAQRYLIPAIEPLLGLQYTIIHQGGNPPTFILKVNKENDNAKIPGTKKSKSR